MMVMNMKIKTPEEIEKKYVELNQHMDDQIPREKDIRKLRDYLKAIKDKTISDDERMAILVKVLSQPTETISLDAQRYALEWVMCQHN